MTDSNDSTFLIIGGGIAGLTLAIAMKRRGLDCAVFERAENKRSTTSAINLGSSGVRVLNELGLLSAIEQRAQPVRWMRLHSAESGALTTEMALLGREQYGQDGMAMTRRVLHEVLMDESHRLGIAVKHGHQLVALSQSASGVAVTFANGVKATGRVCVGADGIHSAVRAAALPDFELETRDRAYFGCGAILPISYLSAAEIAQLRLDEGSMNMFAGQNGFAGFIGVGRPDAPDVPKFMFWTHIAKSLVPDAFDCKDLVQVKQLLVRLRGHWAAPIGKIINLLDQRLPDVEVLVAPITSNGPLPSWSHGRVVLVGDAAHGFGPGASGAALAMEDALLLVRLLERDGDVDVPDTLAQVFRTFEEKRRPRVNAIGFAAEARNNARLVDQGWLRTKLAEWFMWAFGWWTGGKFRDNHAAYSVEDDL